jgi:FkbM family methyltransferase
VQTVQLTTPRGHPARLAVRDQTSDLAVAGSTFAGAAGSPLVDEYGLAATTIAGRFVDVGAHIGAVTVAVLLDNPDATAVLVEPVPENVDMIRANLAANGLEGRAEILQGAVGTNQISYGFEGSETASTNRYIGNLTMAPLRGSQRIQVRCYTLAELLPCAAMKVDCEGGEWALFADRAILTVPLLFGEYHGQPGAEGVLATFGKTHRVTFDHTGGSAGNFRALLR